MKAPIFIFSLPRSGSTLLQRILMGHKDIASVAEPWLMLPFGYAYKKEGTLAEYSHNVSFAALEDFINNLPNKEDDYFEALGIFINTLYEKQCSNNENYFLDKTPRYYEIIHQIERVFPDAKFIFLFRNPIHIMSSIIQTWGDGRLNKLYEYDRDLNFGPIALSEGYRLLKNKSYAMQYEDYVKKPEKYTKEICDYLEIKFDNNMLINFSIQNTKGQMGDVTGAKDYQCINNKTLNKWKKTFNTNFRKKIVYKYIESIPNYVFDIQKYDKNRMLKEIDNLQVVNDFFVKDRLDYMYSFFVKRFQLGIFFGKIVRVWAKDNYLS